MTLLHICVRILEHLRCLCWQICAHVNRPVWDVWKHISRSVGASYWAQCWAKPKPGVRHQDIKVTSVFGSIWPVTRCIPDHRGELALLYPFPATLHALSHGQIQAKASKDSLLGLVKISPIHRFFRGPGLLYERDLGLPFFFFLTFRLIYFHVSVCVRARIHACACVRKNRSWIWKGLD